MKSKIIYLIALNFLTISIKNLYAQEQDSISKVMQGIHLQQEQLLKEKELLLQEQEQFHNEKESLYMEQQLRKEQDSLVRKIDKPDYNKVTLKSIKGESRTKIYSPKGNDASFAFRPFCCTQQLKEGRPWIGFIFICEVEDGEIVSQEEEAKDAKWMTVTELQKIFEETPEKLFTLEIGAWEYYFQDSNR